MRLLAPQPRKLSILSHTPPQKAIPTVMVTHLLFPHLKQSMLTAAQVQSPHTANPRHTEFTALFRIKPYQHHSIRSQKSSKANIVVLIHRMPECDIPILIHIRYCHSMGFVSCLYRQRFQLSSAAVDLCPGKSGKKIPTILTYIKFHTSGVSGFRPARPHLASQESLRADTKIRCQLRHQPNVRTPQSPFPLTHSLRTDRKRLSNLLLCQISLFPQTVHL